MNGPPGSVRVVLLIRFWHPDIPPSQYAQAHHHMKEQYRKHKRMVSMPPLKRAAVRATPLALDK